MADCNKTFTQAEHSHYTRIIYKQQKVSRRSQKRVLTMRLCQSTAKASLNAKRLTRRLRNRYKLRQAQNPTGAWAIPEYIVLCESKGSYTAQNPSGAYGAYQLMPQWWAHLGRKPTPREQDAIASRLWNGGKGASNWVCA